MSLFDLFRGFFWVPGGGHDRGEGRRDPFFDGMTHDDDDDEEEDGLYFDGSQGGGGQQDLFDNQWRFGFSMGPNGVRIQEPEMFGQFFREMEILSQLGRYDGVPSIEAPLSQDRSEKGGGGSSSGNSLRDFMLKGPNDCPCGSTGLPSGPSGEPRVDKNPPSGGPCFPNAPFSKFNDIWRGRLQRGQKQEPKADRDLDSQVSLGGLDQILAPPAGSSTQPKMRSYFQSVTVTKVVKPDGSVEERRTVQDGQGNEETTVTYIGGREGVQDQAGPLLPPGGTHPFSEMHDDLSLFSKFFGGRR
ncbi:HCLS1-associated protein X-1 isoform X3 [Salvelinus namaycush]|uniref:HCLS1-associated protein X-1 isoform X3 n=1 Tax=Salvelinus namaycush TaxID=8040 RepID=A0A8U0PC60_SALNM|nr:HCLS1-associated protein X-1 isoform X3 [Salvelinus namaycush]